MTIAYLYYDLLNLYGESGNMRAIENVLVANKIKHKILYLSLEDDLKFDNYDLVYIGSGTEENLKLAFEHLQKYQKDIQEYIENGKFVFVTGSALDLFGKTLLDSKGQPYKGLQIFDYEIEDDIRKMEEVFLPGKVISSNIIGFINHKGKMSKYDYPLFENEGVHYKNFYGTYVLGPILVRNPDFLRYFVNLWVGKILRYDLKLEKKAYQTFIENYKEEIK